MSRSRPLRVLTYNIHAGRPAAGPVNLEAIAETIAAGEPDVCPLQEVVGWPPPFRQRDQPRRLARWLEMHAAFRPSFGLGPLGFGNAVLSWGKPEAVRRIRLPGRGEPRTVLQVKLEHEDQEFRLLNTHFSLSPRDRMRQVEALLRYATRLSGPVILAGDWNCGPTGEEIQQVEAAGFAVCGPASLATFPSHAPEHRLDYLAVSRHFAVLDAWTVPSLASDHLPLVAELLLNRGDTET